jgi:hypothetical protein
MRKLELNVEKQDCHNLALRTADNFDLTTKLKPPNLALQLIRQQL